METWLVAVVAALAGLGVGWVAAGLQWRLYSEPEFRAEGLAGRRQLFARIVLAALTAAAWAIAFRPDHYEFGPAAMVAGWSLVLLLLSSTDFERRRIPNLLTYPGVVVAAALCWAWPDRSVADIWMGFAFALGVAVVMFGLGLIMGAVLRVNATPFGMGDVKLILLLGLILGWPAVTGALLLGMVAAGLPAIILVLAGRGRGVFSYGPYLALGGLVALLWPGAFT